MTFATLGLTPTLLKAVSENGYEIPTPIQQHAIPAILSGQDVMAAAQTGTGKTAGFTLPMLQLLGQGKSGGIRALVLTPTRELAAQVQDCIREYGKHEKLRSLAVFGGVNIGPQQKALRGGVDILVATPGRLLDLYQQNAVRFDALEMLVLDEADRMLDMGFIRDIRKILALLPAKRQNLLFSATFSDEIRTLARTICKKPIEIDVAPRNSTVELISQQVYQVDKAKKLPLLGKLLTDTADQVLVFSRTKHGANNLVKKLAQFKVQAAAIHGNKSQAQRTKALSEFKNNKVQVLVATDIAARGIDIDQLAMVINFDLPQVPEDYVHRIGRTGRAGASGLAVSLVTSDEKAQLKAIERLIKVNIPRMDINGLVLPEPVHVEESDSQPEPRRHTRQGSGQRRPEQARTSGEGNRPARRRRPAPKSGQGGNGNRQDERANGNQHASRRDDRNGNTTAASGNKRPRSRSHSRSGQTSASSEPQKKGVWASLKSMLGPTAGR